LRAIGWFTDATGEANTLGRLVAAECCQTTSYVLLCRCCCCWWWWRLRAAPSSQVLLNVLGLTHSEAGSLSNVQH
jgi:hypothetical protein